MSLYEFVEVNNSELVQQHKKFLIIDEIELRPNGLKRNIGKALAFAGFVGIIKNNDFIYFVNQQPQNIENIFSFKIRVADINLVQQVKYNELLLYIQNKLIPMTLISKSSSIRTLTTVLRDFKVPYWDSQK